MKAIVWVFAEVLLGCVGQATVGVEDPCALSPAASMCHECMAYPPLGITGTASCMAGSGGICCTDTIDSPGWTCCQDGKTVTFTSGSDTVTGTHD